MIYPCLLLPYLLLFLVFYLCFHWQTETDTISSPTTGTSADAPDAPSATSMPLLDKSGSGRQVVRERPREGKKWQPPNPFPKTRARRGRAVIFMIFFSWTTAQFTGIPSPSMKAEYNKNNWLYWKEMSIVSCFWIKSRLIRNVPN